MEKFNLTEYLCSGVERIIKEIMKVSLKNPEEIRFLVKFVTASGKSGEIRKRAEKNGEHIPPFLIASITETCNLKCKGCYARVNQACTEQTAPELPAVKWGESFVQAEKAGISFILLAGGEPLTRMDVLKEAGRRKSILFPVFTNGTMLEDTYLEFFSANRNLIPVLSIEGGVKVTDARRGEGIYKKIQSGMERLQKKGILFGASVTVTKENLQEVTSEAFTDSLYDHGCKAVIYVEYVPVEEGNIMLAPGADERKMLEERIAELRNRGGMLFISFPGDEKSSGGCLAAGRGFFHINARGGAEPCPFAPYSDTNLLDSSLREALQSPLFKNLERDGILEQEHIGGCVLFQKAEQIREYLKE